MLVIPKSLVIRWFTNSQGNHVPILKKIALLFIRRAKPIIKRSFLITKPLEEVFVESLGSRDKAKKLAQQVDIIIPPEEAIETFIRKYKQAEKTFQKAHLSVYFRRTHVTFVKLGEILDEVKEVPTGLSTSCFAFNSEKRLIQAYYQSFVTKISEPEFLQKWPDKTSSVIVVWDFVKDDPNNVAYAYLHELGHVFWSAWIAENPKAANAIATSSLQYVLSDSMFSEYSKVDVFEALAEAFAYFHGSRESRSALRKGWPDIYTFFGKLWRK